MRTGRALAGLMLGLGLTACATITSAPPGRLAVEHGQRARTYEHRGDLRSALEEWKIALTIDPASVAARAEYARLRRRLEATVARRIRLGQQALGRGNHLQARRHLLAALALDPANTTAFTALREQVPGRRLKIPEGSGLRARPAEPRRVALPSPAEPAPNTVRPATREHGAEAPLLEGNPLLVDTREALERKEYGAALAAVDRLLEGNPRNGEWLELKKAILYRQGKDDLANGLYDDAHRALAQLVRLDPDYRDGPGLLSEARSHAIQLHYNEGIRLSRDEQLEAAIAHWHAVLEHDPQHAEAKRNIEQAERILRVLDEATTQ